jgi:hypothetical protein
MKLNIGAFAHAVAIVWTVLYAICRLLFAVAPKETMTFFGYVMHTDLSPITRPVTWDGFFVGLVVVYIAVAASAGAGAWLYNRLAHTSEAVSGEPTAFHGPVAGGTVR